MRERTRRLLAGSFRVLTVLSAFVWAGSALTNVHVLFRASGNDVSFERGSVVWNSAPARPDIGFCRVGRVHGQVAWWFRIHLTGGSIDGVMVPLWVPFLLIAVPAALLTRAEILARRATAGLCPRCLYDRRGLPGGANCPECGRAAAVQH